MTYLSLAPEGLRACYVTGGLPGLDRPCRRCLRADLPAGGGKNAEYYARYPEDVDRVRRIADHLRGHDVGCPTATG